MSSEELSVARSLVREATESVIRNAVRVQALPKDTLGPDAAAETLRQDSEALQTIPRSDSRRLFAAAAIGENAVAQSSYADALRARTPEFTAEIQAARTTHIDSGASDLIVQLRHHNAIDRPSTSGRTNTAAGEVSSRPPLGHAQQNEIERTTGREATVGDTRLPSAAAAPARLTGVTNDGSVSERFITALDRRLEQSELHELGWKGREDLNDVMRDLRKLATADFQRASDLWSKYRPDDRDRPAFLDSDESAEAKRRGAGSTPRREAEESAEFVTPDHIRKRYVQADNRFYFRHDDNKLAFEDRGNKIATEYNDPVVALSMVQMAEAKGWQTVRLRGSDEFKREAWLQSSLKGIEARGYDPRDVDLQKLAEMQKELASVPRPSFNTVERNSENVPAVSAVIRADRPSASPSGGLDRSAVVDEPQRSLTPAQRSVLETVRSAWQKNGASDREIETAAAATIERFQNQRIYVGRVIERGEAPFERDVRNESSFYLKLDTPKGEKVIWGVDLKRALQETGIKDGDEVVVANQGRQPVQVTVRDRDANGKVTGTSSLTTNRNTWRVETLDSLREDAIAQIKVRAAQADRAPLIPVHDRTAPRADPRPDVTIEQKRGQERTR